VSWSKRFDEPIELPDGTKLRTLQQAVAYLAGDRRTDNLGIATPSANLWLNSQTKSPR
jgi:hypothetical protein